MQNEVYIIVSPSLSASDMSFDQAERMINRMPDLARIFRPRSHIREIEDLRNGSTLKIKTFDEKIVTGQIPAGALIDEIHLLGKNAKAAKVLGQLTGGMLPKPNAFVITITTQSDDEPAGVFKDNLRIARNVRDGKVKLPWLPLLYEFPAEMQANDAWRDRKLWHIVNPNIGRSLTIEGIQELYEEAQEKGDTEIRRWASQHLNIQIGIGMKADGWVGGDYWLETTDPELSGLDPMDALDAMLDRCEVAVVGIDGGGLDDLLGLCVIGREKGTRRWLIWCRAWCHKIVLKRRNEIAQKLLDLDKSGWLKIVPDKSNDDIKEMADIIEWVRDRNLMPEKMGIGCDPAGITDIVDELELRGFEVGEEGEIKDIVEIKQGYMLNDVIKTTERRLEQNRAAHDDSPLMTWCVANAKTELKSNIQMITKQVSGTAKIDPVMAMLNAAKLMSKNPEAAREKTYQMMVL